MGAFLGIFARTPKYSSILSQLVASCENSPFAAQFVYNLLGPVFYELTMMALPSEDLQGSTPKDAAELMDPENTNVIKMSTIIKFLCFVYLESALQYESTEDVFETLTFCNQVEVVELQEFCATSLKSFADNPQGRGKPNNRLLGKRICDYLVLFLGGRIPFYFNEEELTLLHSVFIETILDVFYTSHSEFDLAQSGIWWVQRKIMIPPPMTAATTRNPARWCTPPKRCTYSNALVLLAIVSGVNMFRVGPVLFNCVLLLCSAIWTWVNSSQRLRQRRIILLLYTSSPDAVEGNINGKQSVSKIIHCGSGSWQFWSTGIIGRFRFMGQVSGVHYRFTLLVANTVLWNQIVLAQPARQIL